MLLPKNRVEESTIKSLPTQPTIVASTTRTPHVRNQHVNNLKDINKIQNKAKEESSSIHSSSNYYDIDYSDPPPIPEKKGELTPARKRTSVQHTTENGTRVTLNIALDINQNDIRRSKDPVANAQTAQKLINDTMLGYVKADGVFKNNKFQAENIKLSKDFMKDMGMDVVLDGVGKEYNEYDLDISVNKSPLEFDGGFFFRLTPSNIRPGEEVKHSVFMNADRENGNLQAYIDYIVLKGKDPNNRDVGTALQAHKMNSYKEIAKKQGLTDVQTQMVAGLDTGAYLWPKCGYLVDQTDTEETIMMFENKIASVLHEKGIRTKEENLKVKKQNAALIQPLHDKFTEEGDMSYLEQRLKIEWDNTPAIREHELWKEEGFSSFYKTIAANLSFAAYFNFSVYDTIDTNEHMHKLNQRHMKSFGKPAF